MASDVMSLFGLDPSIIQQQQNQGAVDQASRMNANYAAGAAGGQLMGAAANSAFGLQTPEMAQAQQVQDSMQGADLTTAAGMRAAASKFIMNGQYAQGMALHSKASEMEASDLSASNAAEDREFGKTKTIRIVSGKDAVGQPILSDKLVRYTLDGKVFDMITGEDLTAKVVNTEDDAPEKPTAQDTLEALKNGKVLDNSTLDAAAITGTQQSTQVQNQQNAATQNNIDFYRDKLANMNYPIGSPQTAQIERLLNAELLKLSQNQGTTY